MGGNSAVQVWLSRRAPSSFPDNPFERRGADGCAVDFHLGIGWIAGDVQFFGMRGAREKDKERSATSAWPKKEGCRQTPLSYENDRIRVPHKSV